MSYRPHRITAAIIIDQLFGFDTTPYVFADQETSAYLKLNLGSECLYYGYQKCMLYNHIKSLMGPRCEYCIFKGKFVLAQKAVGPEIPWAESHLPNHVSVVAME